MRSSAANLNLLKGFDDSAIQEQLLQCSALQKIPGQEFSRIAPLFRYQTMEASAKPNPVGGATFVIAEGSAYLCVADAPAADKSIPVVRLRTLRKGDFFVARKPSFSDQIKTYLALVSDARAELLVASCAELESALPNNPVFMRVYLDALSSDLNKNYSELSVYKNEHLRQNLVIDRLEALFEYFASDSSDVAKKEVVQRKFVLTVGVDLADDFAQPVSKEEIEQCYLSTPEEEQAGKSDRLRKRCDLASGAVSYQRTTRLTSDGKRKEFTRKLTAEEYKSLVAGNKLLKKTRLHFNGFDIDQFKVDGKQRYIAETNISQTDTQDSLSKRFSTTQWKEVSSDNRFNNYHIWHSGFPQ